MATTQEAIARLRMIFETQGSAAAVAEMKKLEAAETSLSTSSLNLDRAFANLERRYVEGAAATAQYERGMRTINAALAQNPALAERAAAVTQALTARYQAQMQAVAAAKETQTAFSVGMNAMAAQASAASASTGILGSMLQTFGRVGTAAAVGIGATALAFHKLSEGVQNTVQRAQQIHEFAATTGLSTSQVQALTKEASRFGIETEKLQTGLERFTSQMDDFRQGGGQLLDVVRGIDVGIARQMQTTEDAGKRLELFQRALDKTTDAAQRAHAVQTAFGRGQQAIGQMDFAGGMERFAGRGLAEDTINQIHKLEGEITSRGTNIANKIYGSFAVPWLEATNAVLKYYEAILKIGSGKDLEGAKAGQNLVAAFTTAFPILAAIPGALDAIAASTGRVADETKQAVSEQERLEDAFKKLSEQQSSRPGGRAGVIEQAKQSYPGFEVSDAVKMKTLDDQLKVAQAVTGQAKLQAQEEARIVQLKLENKDAETAIAIAAKERAVAQAEIDAAALRTLAALQDQYAVVSAVTGQDRMRAQEVATRNALIRQGVDAELAGKIAAQEHANQQAAINANAQRTLASLRDQYAVVSAVTNAQKIAAQAQATYNQLVRDGVDASTAGAIAEQQKANAVGAANAAVQQQVIALRESTELILAQAADMSDSGFIGEMEARVTVQQAFNKALRDGADAAEAYALAMETARNIEAKNIKAENQQRKAAAAPEAKSEWDRGAWEGLKAGVIADAIIASIVYTGANLFPEQQTRAIRDRLAYLGDERAMKEKADEARAGRENAIYRQLIGGQTGPAFEQARAMSNALDLQLETAKAAGLSAQQQLGMLSSGTFGRGSSQQDIYNAMKSLQEEIKNNTEATDANTEAQQTALDPIYSQGHQALRIGIYGEGGSGTMRTVTATGWGGANDNLGGGTAQVQTVPPPVTPVLPPPVTGDVYLSPRAAAAQAVGESKTVIQNNYFPPGSVFGDRRTTYQAASAYGRAVGA